MVELNKSTFHTEEFHYLDFLLLGARNELCNLYLNCITYCNFTEIFIHIFIAIFTIYCCIYTCILLSLVIFLLLFPLIYEYKFYCPRACYICKITRAIFNLVKAGLLYLINYIIVYLCIVSSYKEEPCDEAAHW